MSSLIFSASCVHRDSLNSLSTQLDTFKTWGEILYNWDEVAKRKPKLLRQLIFKGIPSPARSLAWLHLSKANDQALKNSYHELLVVSCTSVFFFSFAEQQPLQTNPAQLALLKNTSFELGDLNGCSHRRVTD